MARFVRTAFILVLVAAAGAAAGSYVFTALYRADDHVPAASAPTTGPVAQDVAEVDETDDPAGQGTAGDREPVDERFGGLIDPQTPYTPTMQDINTAVEIFTKDDRGNRFRFQALKSDTTFRLNFVHPVPSDEQARVRDRVNVAFAWAAEVTGVRVTEGGVDAPIVINVVTRGRCCSAREHINAAGETVGADLTVAGIDNVLLEEIFQLFGPMGDWAAPGTSMFVESHLPDENLGAPTAFDAWLLRVAQLIPTGADHNTVRAVLNGTL